MDIDKIRTRSKHLVRFADCDPMGHLYNARYLDYFMHAREDQLRDIHNFDIYDYTRRTGNAWVVVKNQISYLNEARLMEEVVIQSRLIKLTDITAHVEMLMFDKDVQHVKSLLWVEFIHVNTQKRKVEPHGKELNDLFLPLLDTVEETSFDRRSEYMRKWEPSMGTV